MNTEYWFTHAQIVVMISIGQKCSQLRESRL